MPDSVIRSGKLQGAALVDTPHEPGVQKPDAILEVNHMRKAFGGLIAIDVEHLEIQRGIITGLIGPNGAGKTTFFNLLTGFDKPDTGNSKFNGRSVDGKSPHQLARNGMVRTFQLTKSLTKLSVMENMKLGATEQSGEKFWKSLLPPLWRSQEKAKPKLMQDSVRRQDIAKQKTKACVHMCGIERSEYR